VGRSESSGLFDIAVVRYNTDGSLDTSFDSGGIATTPIGSGDDEARAVGIQGDGKIVVAGWSEQSGTHDIALVRYNTDGSLDTSFNLDGKVTSPIGTGDDEAYGVAIQSNGKIIVVGRSESSGLFDIAVVRYNTDGSLDTTFDGDGIVTTPIGIGDDEAYGVAIQSDNKIVVTGRSEQGGTFDTTMVRYEVTSVSSSGGNADPGGGGGCTMNPRGEFDSTLVSLFTLILVYFSWKVFRQHQKNR
jgi:uncharacterized delta-60 repeat protein